MTNGPSDSAVTTQAARALRRKRRGIVTSNRGDKSIRVLCEFVVRHAKYGKYQRRKTVIHAHDEANECSNGDRVEVMECRPISKTKHWRLVKVLERAPGA